MIKKFFGADHLDSMDKQIDRLAASNTPFNFHVTTNKNGETVYMITWYPE